MTDKFEKVRALRRLWLAAVGDGIDHDKVASAMVWKLIEEENLSELFMKWPERDDEYRAIK